MIQDVLGKIDEAIPLNNWRYHVKLNENYSYCKLTGMLLAKGSVDYICCKAKRYMEFITAKILNRLDTFSTPWMYIPQFKHSELRSGKSGNDFYPFDFAGVKALPEVSPILLIPDWVLEVNEKGHFTEVTNGYIYRMKPSDYLKWDFCLKNRIPLLYLNVPKLGEKRGLNDDEIHNLIASLQAIMGCINGYMEEKRITTDKKKSEEYFLNHFCELPYSEIELNEDEFKKSPNLEIEEKCKELIFYVNKGKIKDYVRENYFQ